MIQRLWAICKRAEQAIKSHPAEAAARVLLLISLAIWGSTRLSDLSPELMGIAITVLVIDILNEYRAEQREKRARILQMGSPDNAFAVEAVRTSRVHRWLTDGSLRRADLRGANLQGADLGEANLQEALLLEAKLQGADLVGANLRGAILGTAKLQGANLQGANLQGANLQKADLRWTDLSTALNLETAKLDGATDNAATQWPPCFSPGDAGVVRV